MLKTKAKYIITLITVFIVMCLLNISTVQAVEITETEIQEIIDSIIPDTMNLDIPEIEYKKAKELVPANIKRILEEKSIQYEEVNRNYEIKSIKLTMNENEFFIDFCSISPIDFGNFKEFYTAKININESNYPTKTKTIQLEYSNHNNYNSADEVYVKNLKIDFPKYFEVPLDYLNNDIGEYWAKLVKDYIDNMNKDDDIVFEVSVDGGGAEITMGGVPHVAIFKNGVLYEAKCYDDVDILFIPVIEVPSTIENDKVNEYVVDVVEKYSYYPVTSIKKGCTSGNWFQYHGETCSNIPDIYTIIVSDGTETIEDIAIIRKELNVQAVLDLIPDTMELDIPEVEYKKAYDIILSKVKNVLKTENIQAEDTDYGVELKNFPKQGYNTELTIWASPLYLKEEFYKGRISVNISDGKYFTEHHSKTIDLIYNNHDDFNTADEKYVKNLKIKSPKYYEVNIDYLAIADTEWEEKHNDFYDIIGKYYTKLIGDDSVVVKAEAGVGGADGELNLWTWEQGTWIGIFKNGVLYETRTMGQECTVPVITVPKHIKKDEMNNYVKELITQNYKELGEKITKIEKGTKELGINIQDGYTVYSDYGEGNSYIIIRKEKDITKKDEKSKIKFETTTGVVPEDTKLAVKEIKEEKTIKTIKETLKEVSNKYVIFDISLIHNDKEIQPNGKVKISIPVPNGYDTSNLVVFRIESDGSKIEFKVDVVEIDGIKYAQFETEHFSNYVLVEKRTEKVAEQENSNRVLDDQPKTGIFDIKLFIGIIMVVFTVVVVKNKRKNS